MKNKMPLVSFLAILATMLIGVLVIIGWYTHNDFLISIVPGQIKVKFNVALGFVLSSIVLLTHDYSGKNNLRHRVSAVFSLFVLLIGLFTLVEYTIGYNLGIDELFVRDTLRTTPFYYAGRMSPLLAINFLLIGIGLLGLNREKMAIYQFVYLVGIAFVSFLMVVGFNFISDIPTYIRVAIHGAMGFLLLTTAIYFAQPMLQQKIAFEIKMLTGFVMAIILIIAIGTLSYYYDQKRLSTSRAIDLTNNILHEAREVLSLTKDIVSEGRGYLLTGDSSYFSAFTLAKGSVFTHIKKLKDLTKTDLFDPTKMDSLTVWVNKRIWFSLQNIRLRNENRLKEALQLISTGQGRAYMEKIQNFIDELQRRENDRLVQQERENFNNIASFNRAFFIFLVSVFILLVVIFFYILGNISVRKKTEESLAKLNDELEQKVQERTEKLAASEKLYRELFENMLHGFVYCKVLFEQDKAVDYTATAVNDAYEELTGLTGVKGRKISELIPGIRESYPEIFEMIGRVSLSGKSEQFETYILDRWLSISLYCPERGYFVGLVDNITERKKAEEKLIESENRFRLLIENSADTILLLDANANVLYQSPAGERMTGISAEERQANPGTNYSHPDDVPIVKKAILESVQKPGYPISIQSRFRHTNGYYIWIEGVITNLLNVPGVNAIVVNSRDVTERKKLEDRQALFVSIVNSSDDAILSKTLEGTITSWNPGAQKLFGYSPEEVIGKNVSILIPPDRLNEEPEIIKKIKSGESVDHYETQRMRRDGSLVYISLTVSPIKDNQGNIIGASKISRDISERKVSAEKLAASERRFRALIENSSDGIALVNANSTLVYQSPSVTRILGYTIEERVSQPAESNVHSESLTDFLELNEKLKNNPRHPITFQYRFRHKKGHFIWIEGILTNLIHDPSVNAIVANFRDISERKVAEEALELTLSRFKQAQQVAHLGHWELDFATQKTSWSDEAFRIFGMEPGSIAPSEEVFLNYIHPEDIEMVRTAIENSRRLLIPFSVYHRIVLHTGVVRNLLSIGQYELDKSEKPLRLYGISLDVTELTEKEKMLERANKDLETFIYKASHDLRSPIASILGLINVARAEIKEKKALNYFTMVNEVALKQNKMLLNLIKVMSIRGHNLLPQSVEINEVLKQVLQSQKLMSEHKKVKFIIHQEVNDTVFTDREMISTVLFQLIENSILYSREHDPETHIHISKDKHGNYILEVSDNGIGMSEESVNKIFDMFYRASILSRGSGLGLFLAKTAVEKMGGSIDVSSTIKEGSTFTIKLPAFVPSQQ